MTVQTVCDHCGAVIRDSRASISMMEGASVARHFCRLECLSAWAYIESFNREAQRAVAVSARMAFKPGAITGIDWAVKD